MDNITGKTILVVEDDEDVCSLLQHLLSAKGFSLNFAKDGQEATDLITSSSPPDLILLDIMLPIMDGFEVLAKIQSLEGWSDTPVIMLTAQDTADDIKRGFRAGATDYIVKPFPHDELIEKITSLL
ncbi:MAG TPA: response regulator [Gammaproteobacteria bacterium]